MLPGQKWVISTYMKVKNHGNISLKLNEEEHKQFVENRRKSIKNEFSMVKELMKKNKEAIEEVNDSDDEAKKNMDKNIEMGKKELNDKSSSSSSSKSNSDKEN